jgi:predicted nucleotidyltransferase
MQKVNAHISRIISGLVDRLIEMYQPERIILYGSYAYGSPDEESDIDLLIVKETKDRPIDRRIAVRRLVSDIRKKVPFSSLVVTPEELSNRLAIGDDFFIEITQRGKVLYEK